jgi:hypothetical protein
MSGQSPLHDRRQALGGMRDGVAPLDADLPRVNEVSLEIGLVLTVHLALALAVAMTLAAIGII